MLNKHSLMQSRTLVPVVFISLLLFLGGCEAVSIMQSGPGGTTNLALDWTMNNTGNVQFNIKSLVNNEEAVIEQGKITAEKKLQQYWKSVNVRWGFRKKVGDAKIYWVQKNKNYRNPEDIVQYALEVPEEDKGDFLPNKLPQELSQEAVKKIEVVAMVQAQNQPEKLASIALPKGFLAGQSPSFSRGRWDEQAWRVGPPTKLKVVRSNGATGRIVKLVWIGPAADSTSGYRVSWGATTDPWSSPVFTSEESYTLTGDDSPSLGTKFEFRVMAIARDPYRWGIGNSDWVRSVPVDSVVLPTPSRVFARMQGSDVQVLWSLGPADPDNASGGALRRALSGFELSWGATTGAWSEPVFTKTYGGGGWFGYTIPRSKLPPAEFTLEVKVRSIGPHGNYYSPWTKTGKYGENITVPTSWTLPTPSRVFARMQGSDVQVLWSLGPADPDNASGGAMRRALSGFELSWGATTGAWSEPVFTKTYGGGGWFGYTIPRSKLPPAGSTLEVRVRSLAPQKWNYSPWIKTGTYGKNITLP